MLSALLPSTFALVPHGRPQQTSALHRRGVLELGAAAAASAFLPAAPAVAAEDEVKMYFGAGCFWHVQHEFILKEAQELGRSGAKFTAVSGYAGGVGPEVYKLGNDGRLYSSLVKKDGVDQNLVCYHNRGSIADYGRLGHAEAVQVSVPTDVVPAFAKKYISIFGQRGFRHDPQDRGGEYRSVLGLPGGTRSPHYKAFEAALEGSPMKLVASTKGSDGDTLGERTILVMDSDKFPFYPAELYHQFHNDFQGPAYGKAYNMLQGILAKEGKIGTTGCPEDAF